MTALDRGDDRSQAEAVLRAHVRAALRNASLSQAEAARQLDVSTKHLCQMLTGRAPLTLGWAERILALCGQRIVIDVQGAPPREPDDLPGCGCACGGCRGCRVEVTPVMRFGRRQTARLLERLRNGEGA